MFGEELSQLINRGTQYKGGINKSEIMHRCYRTPGEILTAAHAIGMGLLRPDGILSGLTRKKEWKSIGYEVPYFSRYLRFAGDVREPLQLLFLGFFHFIS